MYMLFLLLFMFKQESAEKCGGESCEHVQSSKFEPMRSSKTESHDGSSKFTETSSKFENFISWEKC